MSVLMVTSLGEIVVDLFTEKCPLTCKNFLKLCKIKYYNGCLFHTVQKDFTAQTGDPTGTGSAGDSIYKFLYGDQARFFSDEIHLDLKHTKMGTVAMASAGENLNASQFYITLRDGLDYLDGKHTIFGEVAEGHDTLMRINEAYVDDKSRPYKNIRIKHTYILDDPFDDPSQLEELIPPNSPEGKPKDEIEDEVRLEDDWVPMDEQLGAAELEEVLRVKQAHSSAVVLEAVGDIPDAEIKPPDNVLFVCKLNPVTEDEDLHTIFSRFGTVVSADIIRDYKTGDSLCYAFIEFETKESCEQAYFKMDNALIDDRRIHVDFSQSVAKQWSEFRRGRNQTGEGKGCFKCGAPDHIAKDCTGGAKQQPSKYILKEDNMQHGGDHNSRYEMVFDEDTPGGSKEEKMQRRSSIDLKHGDHRARKDSPDRYRESNRDRKFREDRRNFEDRSKGRYNVEREDRERKKEHGDRERRKERDDYMRDDRDHRKRETNIEYHGDRRNHGDSKKNSGNGNHATRSDYRSKNSDGNHRRRRAEDGHSREEFADEREYRKRHRDGER